MQTYVTVRSAWIIFVGLESLIVFCAWRFPHTRGPMAIGIAAAAVLAVIMHL